MSLSSELQSLALTQFEAALRGGEPWAIRRALDTLLPTARPVPLQELTPQSVRLALAAGVLSMSEAGTIADVLSKLRAAEALDQMEARLVALETLLHGTPQTMTLPTRDGAP